MGKTKTLFIKAIKIKILSLLSCPFSVKISYV